ncbi:DNA-directed RNA polymerase sigma-70 factor [Virgisporangium aurantiacum]|uniref:DNA-directed RNA polymerase sigma-70 factor n=1 Tax=Virgisporangium aurantiacum TaxID=175570 RepID=A0A8J3ZIX1_9ACTN|nr:DNA-directed RNA polymerase sigma-70 factor [Virgisporangium aurantiacum]
MRLELTCRDLAGTGTGAEGDRCVPTGPDIDFNAFVRARTGALLRTAYLLTGDRHLAEDLVQDALAKAHRARRRLTSESHLEAYTRTAIYHLHIRWWQRRKARSEVLAGEWADPRDPTDHPDRVALRLSLQHALAQLNRRQRLAVVLRYFEDKTERETAELLSCSVGTVKSLTSRALARLRQIAPELDERSTGKGV